MYVGRTCKHIIGWNIASCLLILAGCAGPLENRYLRLDYNPSQPTRQLRLTNKLTGEGMDLSVCAPQLKFEQGLIGGPEVLPDRITLNKTNEGSELILNYPEQTIINTPVRLRTVFLVPADKGIVRKYATFEARPQTHGQFLTLHKVILIDEPLPEKVVFTMTGWQSYPVFTDQYFFGLEFPVANAAVADGRVVLSHMPGKVMNLPVRYRTRDAIIGVCAEGQARETFERYVESFRRQHDSLHFNYNGWWTSPVPYSENDILLIINALHEGLYKPFGVPLDSFTIDLGWSAKRGIWQINKSLLPYEFTRFNDALSAQKCRLGLWFSPSNNYSPVSFDNKWAEQQGYETQLIPGSRLPNHFMCLAKGTRYQTEAKQALSNMVIKFKLGQMKFDGYHFECTKTDHGHLPGELSREITAEGIIDIFAAVRQLNPDIWLESTCFGYNASPWWLRYVDSVIGPFGDDAPYGSVPAPIHRESYTSSRDFFNLHGSVTPVPIAAQEVLGIIHQTPEPFYNDAVVVVLRGHQFISLYLNPKYIQPNDYAFLSKLIAWSRANAGILSRTKILHPQQWRQMGIPPGYDMRSIPRQTYGYLHWRDGQGLICLRNPWMQMDQVELILDEAVVGIDEPIADYSAVQVYPFQRCLSKGLKYGDRLPVKMGPYETKVIILTRGAAGLQPEPDPLNEQFHPLTLTHVHSDTFEIVSKPVSRKLMSDPRTFISLPQAGIRWESMIEAETADQGWQLYYLLEADKLVNTLDMAATINGKQASPRIIDSESGWSATLSDKPRFWRWFVLDVPKGKWKAHLCLDIEKAPASGTAWLVRSFEPPRSPLQAALQEIEEPGFPMPPGYKAQISREVIKTTALQVPGMKKVALTLHSWYRHTCIGQVGVQPQHRKKMFSGLASLSGSILLTCYAPHL